ncbi:MAG: anthranilate phosphoribosyltransferase [Elusimicrobia bacterium]|nr:anthranilate phosphoribosyltransferase [Elusimicrobiota bacterium]
MVLALLKRLLEGSRLSRGEARSAMDGLMEGSATPGQIGAFLAALKVRGETEEELAGFAEAMRARAIRVSIDRRPLLDTCGTGGDGAGTFNISTAAAFVAAGAGAAVAKHGNRSVSSRCGSADVLEALGVKPDPDPALANRCVSEAGLCFLFAPAFHPATRHVAPVRRELGVRTVFNLLGPLANPAGATRQLMGVYDGRLLAAIATALRALGTEEAMVVAAADGLDELSPSAPTRVAHLKDGRIREYEVTPESAGVARQPEGACKGGDAAENARILREVLEGRPGPAREAVRLNAAAALVVTGLAEDLRTGAVLAGRSIDSGKALKSLETLKLLTNGHLAKGAG